MVWRTKGRSRRDGGRDRGKKKAKKERQENFRPGGVFKI